MTCAKAHVLCTIVTPDGRRFTGTNACRRPQPVCPRLLGEGYAKCRDICDQEGHAETVALDRAGAAARGATAYVEGRSYCCRNCQEALYAAGVLFVAVGRGPEGVYTPPSPSSLPRWQSPLPRGEVRSAAW